MMAESIATASGQDYLEAILQLSADGPVRSVDIAQRLSVSRASVNRAIGVLKAHGLVTQPRYGAIALTPAGEELARGVQQRHRVLKEFLTDVLQIDPATAELDACRMEHVISAATMESLIRFLDKRHWGEA